MSFRLVSCLSVAVLLLSVGLIATTSQGESRLADASLREKSSKLMQDGNFKEALAGYKQLCLEESTDAAQVSGDLQNAVQCLRRLGTVSEFDELVEQTIDTHSENWRLQEAAAQQYLGIDHRGYQIAGEFVRGPHRGGGQVMSAMERDRVRALQLMREAMPLADKADEKGEVAQFYIRFGNMLMSNRGYAEAWRLQYLTDLSELPDYEEGHYYYRNSQGAPVDEEGNPVFYSVPDSWDTAVNDGQRWRWSQQQAIENAPNVRPQVRQAFAQFLHQQFGVQTMASRGWYFPRGRGMQVDDGDTDESGTYALHTLKENETIAQLATGIKRFELPDEFNFIKIYQELGEVNDGYYPTNALETLAQIFENRRQYPRAAEFWREAIERFGPGNNQHRQQRLAQIIDNWGQFETVGTQPAGEGATVEFRFRNAERVSFTAHELKVDKLLADVKEYLKRDPGRIDWQTMQIENLGYRIVQQNQKKYRGEQVASWQEKLDPREKHFDKRVTISTPLRKGGAYLLTADVADGNKSFIVLWVADAALVRKPLNEKSLYYVCDAVGGEPVEGANLEFFGYRQESIGGNKYRVLTTNFAERTGEHGTVIPDPRDLKPNYNWLAIARTKSGSMAYSGFRSVWSGNYHDAQYQAIKIYTITDRPVYRPEQKVHFKVWVRHAQYDKDDVSQFANHSVMVEVRNPKNEKLYEKNLQTDEYGGLEGELELPDDATLGQYNVSIRVPQSERNNRIVAAGGGNFRVEEYKKPEYEVTIEAPTEPVMLGEKIQATIKAKYYFGSPVTNAKVKYKITRSEHSDNWYPQAPWDWYYGEGYWWFGYDYTWYPGWNRWHGCVKPAPWWYWQGRRNPPEVVAEQEVEIGDDGTVEVEIDTQLAKEIHGDQDHQYSITAEVRDQSRRTIVGNGEVLVARKPFKVFAWVDRGYYRVGEVITANFQAQTIAHEPVEGEGELTLMRVTYKDNEPVETPVRTWKLDTNDQGNASLQLRASESGQYRLAYQLTDKNDHTIEGGYLFTIMGAGFDGSDFRFNDLELVPDKKEYAPGEKVKLQVNTNRVGATVLLFVRPSNGVYLEPQVLDMQGKSRVVEIEVTKKDMPNFFVEAVTVYGGDIYVETKEIVVPPEKRVLNVEVLPSQEEYLPGEEAKVKVKVTDHTGEGYVGSTVVSIYDKSVEYIAGGGNTTDIRKFFWEWRRQHQPKTESSLGHMEGNLNPPNKPGMGFLGVFGATVADDLAETDKLQSALGGATRDRARFAKRAELRVTGGFGGGAPQARFGYSLDAAPTEEMRAEGEVASNFAAAGPADKKRQQSKQTGNQGDPNVEPTVRENFADTALWVGKLETDKTGTAEVSLTMPENLTAWKMKVWAMGHGTRVGSGEAEAVTRKNLIIRLQAPRFMVERDEVVLSANVHNYLDEAKQVTVQLDLPGELVKPLDGIDLTQQVEVEAGGEQRVDWRVKVLKEGEQVIRMKALTDVESDAMQVSLPVKVHGILKTESWAGTVRPEQQQQQITINVPAERRDDQSQLEIRYSPTLAGAMVDALPYLADYPYGCTEQTLNRFLPAVITQKTLLDMNLNLAEIQQKRTNLNAQEIGNDRERAKQWKRFDRNPVFDTDELNRMVRKGLQRLTNMQNSDGGWGWFSGTHEQSYPHTTAVVVHGLQVAKQTDAALVPGTLEKGIEWLKQYQQQEVQKLRNAPEEKKPYKLHADNLDAFVYMVLVDAEADNQAMRDFLYRDRVELSVYAKAMFGLALQKLGDEEKLAMIVRNIEQFVVQDPENETAYLRLPENNYWWYWYGSEVEANAYFLKLLAHTEPKGKTAPRLVKYLLNNRKHATYWSNTRDTAICVEAFADYLKASGELEPNMTVQVLVDGEPRQQVKIDRDNLFTFDNKFLLEGADLTDGSHEISIRRQGQGPVYFNAYLTNFTLEDMITKAGLEVKVERNYYHLVPEEKIIKAQGGRGQAVDQRVEDFRREPIENLDTVKSGELVEIELVIESKNDYEYLIFEDPKAAGFEPYQVQSGYHREGLGAYMELRDDRVTFFVRRLARGKHSIAYKMRAETPGRFSALPTQAHAMYAPELKGNSDEIKVNIAD